MAKYNGEDLKQLTDLDLDQKIKWAKEAIENWYKAHNGNVYVSFSGGKDSVVLLDLARSVQENIPAVFLNTGLEFPEVVDVVKATPNTVQIRPKKTFRQVIEHYGYPVVSKEQAQYIHEYRTTKSDKLRDLRWNGRNGSNSYKISEKWKYLVDAPFKISAKCCDALKKNPSRGYEKKSGCWPMIGTKTNDSIGRKNSWLRHGCNMYDSKRPLSHPLSVWSDDDIWAYIKAYNLNYPAVYDMGYNNTGCIFCAFGAHLENPNKFQVLKKTHLKKWSYCMDNLGMGQVLDFIGIPAE